MWCIDSFVVLFLFFLRPDIFRDGRRIRRRLQLFMLLHLGPLLKLVVVDDILIRRARLKNKIRLMIT